jgi:hypothetical protein
MVKKSSTTCLAALVSQPVGFKTPMRPKQRVLYAIDGKLQALP